MEKRMFSVYDSKADAYLPPFVALSRGVAVRMVRGAAMDVTHDFNKFGGDYTLFEIGLWDEKAGQVVMYEAHDNLGTALSLSALEE